MFGFPWSTSPFRPLSALCSSSGRVQLQDLSAPAMFQQFFSSQSLAVSLGELCFYSDGWFSCETLTQTVVSNSLNDSTTCMFSHSLVWFCEIATSIVIHNLRALTAYMSWLSFDKNCFIMSLDFNDFAYGKIFHPDLLPQSNISDDFSLWKTRKFFQLSELIWKWAEQNLIPSIYDHV